MILNISVFKALLMFLQSHSFFIFFGIFNSNSNRMYKSINSKYFLLVIFFVLNSFSVSTSIKADYEPIDVEATLSRERKLEYYPESLTSKVNQKLA